MQNIHKPLFFSLIGVLIFLSGVAILIFFMTRPPADHAIPYHNSQMPGPSGYSWKDYSTQGVKFLIPDNWFLDEDFNNKEQYTVSKISWEVDVHLITGMVLDVVRNIDFPDIQTRSQIEEIIASDLTRKIVMKDVRREGKATIREIQIISTDQSFPENDARYQKEIFYRFIARPDLHILYAARFETPASQWDADWEQGKVLLDNLTFTN